MHPTDGNLYALNKHLAEGEAYERENGTWEGYCGSCDDFHEVANDIDYCPECDADLHDGKDDWATSQETPLATQ